MTGQAGAAPRRARRAHAVEAQRDRLRMQRARDSVEPVARASVDAVASSGLAHCGRRARLKALRLPAGSLQQRDDARELVAHLAAVDDHVDRAVLEQELGALEALRQRLAHGLLDHARAGEADQRLGLGDHDVADDGEARRHAAHGRVGQHAR